MKLLDALNIYAGLEEILAPACHRIEVAGSIRRRCPDVHDIEIVAIPRIVPMELPGQQETMFDGPKPEGNAIWKALRELRWEGRVQPISGRSGRPGSDREDDSLWHQKWKAEPLSKMFKLWLPKPQIAVDLFMPTAETWGCIYTIRTGSADFSARLVRRRFRDMRFHQGRIRPVLSDDPAAWEDAAADTFNLDESRKGLAYMEERIACTASGGTPLGQPYDTPEEEDVFSRVGLDWVGPEARR